MTKKRSAGKPLANKQRQSTADQSRPARANVQRARVPETSWQLMDQSTNLFANATEPVSLLDLATDNAGQSSWRKRETPRRTISIPEELLVLSGQEQFYEAIARTSETFIFPLPPNPAQSTKARSLGVWGEVDNVNTTVQHVNDYITREKTSKNASGANRFGTVRSLTEKDHRRLDKLWLRDLQKHRFRQAPPSGSTFQVIGAFIWPEDIHLVETLGHALEALDPIRLDCACYILLKENKAGIQVLGNEADVGKAIDRIRGTIFQLIARKSPPVSRYLIDEQYGVPDRVAVKQAEIFDRTDRQRTTYEGEDWDTVVQHTRTGKKITSLLLHKINHLQHLHAHIRFRIRLGTFLAVQHMQPEDGSFAYEDFKTMLTQAQFFGETHKNIGRLSHDLQLYELVRHAQGLLTPHDVMTNNLQDVRPEHTVTFTFLEGIHLTLKWQEQVDLSSMAIKLIPCGRRWSRQPVNTRPNRQIDIHLLNLQRSTAWHFEMHSSSSLEESRVPGHLLAFANRIKVDEALITQADTTFVLFTTQNSLTMLTMKACYKYRYAASDYSLELSRVRCFEYAWRNASRPTITTTGPAWQVAVGNVQWDTMLEENDRLEVGQSAAWSLEKAAWLPRPEGGYDEDLKHLLKIMHDTEKLLQSAMEESVDNETGMAIG